MNGIRSCAIVCGMILLAAAAPPLSGFPGAAAATIPLFGTKEIQSANQAPFPKWRGALTKYFDERKLLDEPCSSSIFNKCHLKEWQEFLKEQKGRARKDQVEAVNEYMNRHRYFTDPRNYGISDYWASPTEFLQRDGDCEDYAIAKFISLRALGFDNSEVRLVVVHDLNLKLGHAILVVYLDGKALILDNQIREVVEASFIRHYKPIYSINEVHWWMHQ
jgi:predicted transglutaminase-like cysteine proteinase